MRSCRPPPPPPETSPVFGPTVAWLREVDARLRATNERVLVAIDEVEALEDGIRSGWGSPEFLTFVRAAADALGQIRLLLLAARPPSRIGPHWTDRLISLVTRNLDRLSPDEAAALLTAPADDFPPIWPAGAVDRVVEETGGHPYLLQAVGYKLVERLNQKQALRASAEDVERALEDALQQASTSVFANLWAELLPAERVALRAFSGATDGATPVADAAAIHNDLASRGFLVASDGAARRYRLAVPLLARWIRMWAPPDDHPTQPPPPRPAAA